MQFLHHVAHQAAPAQQVAAELFDELFERALPRRGLRPDALREPACSR